MGFVYVLPDLGEGIAEAEVVRWHVAEGDDVQEDDPLVEVVTAKATVDAPSPRTGKVLKVVALTGETIQVGDPLAVIGEAGEDVEAILQANAKASSRRPAGGAIQVLPSVRKLAAELGVSLEALQHSGPITADVVRAAAQGNLGAGVQGNLGVGVRARRRLQGVGRAAAQNLSRAQLVPTVMVVEEAQLDALFRLQQLLDIGYVPFLVQAAIAAFREVPEANARFDEAKQELVIYDQVDMAVAVHLDEGLAVPVMSDCAGLSLRELAEKIRDLGERAHANALSPSESMGGTFTVSCPGDAGVLLAAPLLNVPQVGLLALHRLSRRPIVVDGRLAVGWAAHVTFTHDHRAINGMTACHFLRRVVELLSKPLQALEAGIFRPGDLQSQATRAPRPGAAEPSGALAAELGGLPEPRRRDHLIAAIEARLRKQLNTNWTFDRSRTWSDLGLNSYGAVSLRSSLSDALGCELPSTLLYRHATPVALAEHLLGLLRQPAAPATLTPVQLLQRLRGMQEQKAHALLVELTEGRAARDARPRQTKGEDLIDEAGGAAASNVEIDAQLDDILGADSSAGA
ncbi:2-oxo acid dehydrogenase subunit E2 [Sorangium sp. So ce381]|uniref:2-oxo acid dehydrogenase subunit E2 n=1 Tax=Sorangium sp. So ce381 TaxID=3133307 RepID=UPI003F5B13F8